MREAFRIARAARPFSIGAIVVLPDHLHCLWTLPQGDSDNATRWRHIKALFARALPATERVSSSRQSKGERGIWQRRYWAHLIVDDEDFRRHADYIHFNPVKHGHVERAADWPHSSFHRYVARGDLAPDWAEVPRDARWVGRDPPYDR